MGMIFTHVSLTRAYDVVCQIGINSIIAYKILLCTGFKPSLHLAGHEQRLLTWHSQCMTFPLSFKSTSCTLSKILSSIPFPPFITFSNYPKPPLKSWLSQICLKIKSSLNIKIFNIFCICLYKLPSRLSLSP